jgi:hypothetical protein
MKSLFLLKKPMKKHVKKIEYTFEEESQTLFNEVYNCQNLRIGFNPKLVLIRKNFVLPNKKKSISIKIYLIRTYYQLVL